VKGPVCEALRKLSLRDSPKLVVPKNCLQGDTTVTFIAQIVPEDDPASAALASVPVRVGRRGVVSRLPAKSVTVPANKDIRLDGSLAKDRDNLPGALEVMPLATAFSPSPLLLELVFVDVSSGRFWRALPHLGGVAKGRESGAVDGVPRALAGEESASSRGHSGSREVRGKMAFLTAKYLAEKLANDVTDLFPTSLRRYNFTLCVSKKGSTSCASMEIMVVRGKVPTFVLAVKDTKVNPNERLLVKAVVDNAPGACVSWASAADEGYAVFELAAYSNSAETSCFAPNGKDSVRGYHLDIPSGTLGPGLKYLFVLTGRNGVGTGSASVTVHTMMVPNVGECKVNVTEVDALAEIVVSCSGFSDSDDDLTYTFSVSVGETGEHFFLGETEGGDDADFAAILPSGQVHIHVEVCNNLGGCTNVDVSETLNSVLGDVDDEMIE